MSEGNIISSEERFKKIINAKSLLEQAAEDAQAVELLERTKVSLPPKKVTGSLMSEVESEAALARVKGKGVGSVKDPTLSDEELARLADANLRRVVGIAPAQPLAENMAAKIIDIAKP